MQTKQPCITLGLLLEGGVHGLAVWPGVATGVLSGCGHIPPRISLLEFSNSTDSTFLFRYSLRSA